jgi:hypothetical protein
MLRRWASNNDVSNSRNLSHVLMDGGCLSIPCDKILEFYDVYCDAVNAGEKVFVVEQKTQPAYNFFADLDYKAEEALTVEEIEAVCRVICAKVGNLGGGDCVVSVAEPKPAGEGLVKTGVHLNWPGFVVDQASACALREHILIALHTAKPGVNWGAVVDNSVYGDPRTGAKGSGFRMPWSHKKAKGVVEGPYLPVFRWTRKPLSTMLRLPPEVTPALLSEVAVRVTEGADVAVKVVHPPSALSVAKTKEGGFSKSETKDEVHDDAMSAHLETFIRTTMEGQASARVTKIFKHKNQFLVSTTSKYCENLAREHGSNHVWFYVSGDLITQKCFCRCETLEGRADGFCKDFTGKRYALTGEIKRMLYPEPTKCPPIVKKIKKKERRPTAVDEARVEIQAFIQTYGDGFANAQVIELKKVRGGFAVTTNAACRSCGRTCAFNLKRDILTQACECKGGRKMKIFSSTYKKLAR